MASTNMGGSGRGRGGGMIVGINVTPMVDVVLVLLVIMMVSATYIVSQSLKVNLPTTSGSDGAVNSVAAVSIAADGSISYNGQRATIEQLRGHVGRAVREDAELTLVVSADRAASHGRVVEVMDTARALGVTSFAVQVEQRAE